MDPSLGCARIRLPGKSATSPLRQRDVLGRVEAIGPGRCNEASLCGMGRPCAGRCPGETAVCSVGYDVLLKRHFGGDFEALLACSRRQRHATAAD